MIVNYRVSIAHASSLIAARIYVRNKVETCNCIGIKNLHSMTRNLLACKFFITIPYVFVLSIKNTVILYCIPNIQIMHTSSGETLNISHIVPGCDSI